MKHFTIQNFFLLFFVLALIGCEDQVSSDTQLEPVIEMSRAELDQILETKMNAPDHYNWKDGDLNLLWNALRHGQNVVTVGYGNMPFSEDDEFAEQKETVIRLVETSEGYERSAETMYDYDIINAIDLEVTKLETLKQLLHHPDVRYVNPVGYGLEAHENPAPESQQRMSSGGSGCGTDADNINSDYVSSVSPSAQVSWNYENHNIEEAWSESTGAGITIGLIDTGVASQQDLLNTVGFNDGDSNNRTVEKYGTFIDSWWWWSNNYDGPHDKCGHGTSMASAMAAPRNNNAMPVGVAYNSNLVAYRATENVVLNDYHERKGVTDALIQLANRSDVKIISMSIGYPWGIGNIEDAVEYAYSKGKLIFAAGGTSFSITSGYGVIFPAYMDECVAVTGVTDATDYEKCSTCHDGSEIELTIQMQMQNDTDAGPVVMGFYNNERKYTGGSSVATATTAGIAALVWSKYPNWSRSQVITRLHQSADFYPNKDSDLGYGNIDAQAAVQ